MLNELAKLKSWEEYQLYIHALNFYSRIWILKEKIKEKEKKQ